MYSRKIALSHARQIRKCPPYAILKDPNHAANVERHLAVCPYCRENLDEMSSMARLAEKLAGTSTVDEAGDVFEPAPGQIRYIRSDKADWSQGYYFNPPMLVVLDLTQKISDDIRVAQIYDDIGLAGPGDLILNEEQTGTGELFVECWNTYTLKAAYLGTLVGQVSSPVMDAILRQEADPEDIPSWTPLPFPLRENDPRIHFRKLEVETAFFFSSRAAGELMEELERTRIRLVYGSLSELSGDVAKKVPGIRFPQNPSSFEEALAFAEVPWDRLPLAAADEEEKIIVGNRVVVRGGRIEVFEPITVDILQTHEMPGGKSSFTGRFPVDPEKGRPVRVIFGFALSGDTSLETSGHPFVDMEKGLFSVVFDTPSRDWRRLRLGIVYAAE